MSEAPNPPGRGLTKNSQWPSEDRPGLASSELELTVGPTFTGAPHAAVGVARCETHRSRPPEPPGRVESKYRLRSSGDSAGFVSAKVELTTGPRFTGADHPV